MTAVEDFQSETETLAATVQRHVLMLYAAYLAGELPEQDVVPLIVAAINQATSAAVALGDVWLVAQIEERTGAAALATGVPPTDDADRLTKAVSTVLAERDSASLSNLEPDPTVTRLDRLARSETFEAAQNGTWQAMQQQPLVEGWVRQMEAGRCQLCEWWSRDSRVWPKAHPFQRHKGCNCQPRIVLADNIKSTGYTRRLERNARAS
ncbi:hypothetical protein KXD97_19840 [Mycobacterium sp. SMC-8]|uniref:hypothetical protein n=1 Tax=Mycobacterium sp. SMC-8 TaxID=2857060 RepID=UPI000C1B07C5|nr:hypothetical protein [Mycobacterium sp. SMC-8]UXA10378.1 hypothetical protein KXD97_19840 [Mycobacterium sp. SMC-8]